MIKVVFSTVGASLWGPQFFPHLSAAPVEDRPTQDGKPHTAAPQLRPPKGCILLLPWAAAGHGFSVLHLDEAGGFPKSDKGRARRVALSKPLGQLLV